MNRCEVASRKVERSTVEPSKAANAKGRRPKVSTVSKTSKRTATKAKVSKAQASKPERAQVERSKSTPPHSSAATSGDPMERSMERVRSERSRIERYGHPSAAFPEIDMRLGPYRLCRRVGVGGMGAVFLAEDARRAGAHRNVAVKCIHPHLCDNREFVDMFLDEADVASRIDHPNVVRVFDYGQLEDAPFLVMEYLTGEPLSATFKAIVDGRCPWSAERRAALCARIVADACEGLHAAHELSDEAGLPLDVVHRDVSPQNLFVTYDGVVKVVDFGTVKAATQRHRTRTGMIKGKCAYIAPEILLGHGFDRRADVWALGVILWELLTGRRLFLRKHDGETVRAVLEHEVVSPSKLDRSIPQVYDMVVMAALQRDPAQRFATARDLGRVLQAALVQERQAVDLSSIAEWMGALFADGREAHESMLSCVGRSRLVDRGNEHVDDGASTFLFCSIDEVSEADASRMSRCGGPPSTIDLDEPTRAVKIGSSRALVAAIRRPPQWLGALAGAASSAAIVAFALREPGPMPNESTVSGAAVSQQGLPSQVSPLPTTSARASAIPAPPRLTAKIARRAEPRAEARVKRGRDGSMFLEVWAEAADGDDELVWYGAVPEPPNEKATACPTQPPRVNAQEIPRYPTDI